MKIQIDHFEELKQKSKARDRDSYLFDTSIAQTGIY